MIDRFLVMDGKRHVFLTGGDGHAVELLTPDAALALAVKLTESAQRVMGMSRVDVMTIREEGDTLVISTPLVMNKLPDPPLQEQPVEPTPEIMDMLRRDRWINAIRALRAARGLSLKDAKDRIDEWRERYGLLGIHPEPVDPPSTAADPPAPPNPGDITKTSRRSTEWIPRETAVVWPHRKTTGGNLPWDDLERQLPGRTRSMIKGKIARLREAYQASTRKAKNLPPTSESLSGDVIAEPDALGVTHPDILNDALNEQVSAVLNEPADYEEPSHKAEKEPAADSPSQAAFGAGGTMGRPWRARAPLIATKLPDTGPIRQLTAEELMRGKAFQKR